MDEDSTTYLVIFHDRAQRQFFQFYRAFQQSIQTLDRQGCENKFQQTKGLYSYQLKQALEEIARELLLLNNEKHHSNLIRSLSYEVEKYMREFEQKVRCL